MNSGTYRVRRATTDDVSQLNSLWKSAQLPAVELEKRFTEFQVAESVDGKIVGTIGLQIANSEGKIHSEAYTDFALTDQLRPLLWERLQSVANNHGLFRVWTDEPAPFWKKDCGFVEASADVMAKIPALFSVDKKNWLVLQLKEDRAAPNSLEAEFARLRADEQERNEKLHQQARVFRGIAWGLAGLLFIFTIIGFVYLFRYKASF
jgi:N-acetylglutamate synthase-like GNAT family acetyltransferase